MTGISRWGGETERQFKRYLERFEAFCQAHPDPHAVPPEQARRFLATLTPA